VADIERLVPRGAGRRAVDGGRVPRRHAGRRDLLRPGRARRGRRGPPSSRAPSTTSRGSGASCSAGSCARA
jgi:hypothetical protein